MKKILILQVNPGRLHFRLPAYAVCQLWDLLLYTCWSGVADYAIFWTILYDIIFQ
jgi:hypothetical protein